MSVRISTTVSNATYDAMLDQAKRDGQASTPDKGKGYVIRKAVRAWLNKNRHSSTLLDMDDDSYAERLLSHTAPLPRTRNGTLPPLAGSE